MRSSQIAVRFSQHGNIQALVSSTDIGSACSVFLAAKGRFSDLTACEEAELTAAADTKRVKDKDSEGNRP